MTAFDADPFEVLGVAKNASEKDVRSRYLELVKRYPPERDADRFRAIQSAFELVKDPLAIAEYLADQVIVEDAPAWQDAIDSQKDLPPRLPTSFLLSLGNNREKASRVSDQVE